jgi:hypothetical protein
VLGQNRVVDMAEDLGKIEINKRFGANMVDQNYINQMMAQKAAMQQAQQQIQSTQVPEYDNPYRKNPLGMALSTLAMGIGEGMTGRPFLTNFNNNLYEQKQAQLKYKQWQEQQVAKAAEDASQAALRDAQIAYYKAGATGVGAGGAVPEGMEVTGYDPRGRPIVRKSEEVKAMESQKRKDVSAFKAYLPDYKQINTSLDQLEKEAKGLGDFKTGVVEQTIAKVKLGVDKYSKSNKALNMYTSVVAEKLIPMARKVMEEKGPITEFDVARVEKALGDETLPLSQKMEIIGRFRDQLKQQISLKAEIAGEDVSKYIGGAKQEKVDPEYAKYLKSIEGK